MRVDKGVPVKQEKGAYGEGVEAGLQLAAIGLEAEFELYVDDHPVRPERIFRDPREIVRAPMMHRTGRSYHLPTGSAIYFDTGVIELATPAIEISRGCAARAGRSLWEAILYLRTELDAWEWRTRHVTRLQGFSAHYNVSFEADAAAPGRRRHVEDLALLLSYVLPVPVMLLATNRASTGVGVRPRKNRVEITVDFTPSPSLMIATATLITGVVRSVMAWPSFDLRELQHRHIPVITGYSPIPHTSRNGWLARLDCFPRSPFDADVHRDPWQVENAVADGESVREMTLRTIAASIFNEFRDPIRRIADPFTYRMLGLVMNGSTTTLLDLEERPKAYEDVGRLCLWDNLFPESVIRRSMYERILIRAISGQKLRMNGDIYTPIGLHGWSEVVFRRDRDGIRRRVGFDRLLRYLRKWERVS